MRNRYFAQRTREIGLLAGRFAKAVGWADGEYEGRGICVLMIAEEFRQLLRRKLFSPRIKKNQPSLCSAAIATTQLQQRSLIFEGRTFCFSVLPQALQILIGE